MENREELPIDFPEGDSATVCHDWLEDGSPSLAVVTAVAEATGGRPEDLRPLNEVVDPDRLDGLFGRTSGGPDGGVHVTFRFEGCTVIVASDGRTIATPIDRTEARAPRENEGSSWSTPD